MFNENNIGGLISENNEKTIQKYKISFSHIQIYTENKSKFTLDTWQTTENRTSKQIKSLTKFISLKDTKK